MVEHDELIQDLHEDLKEWIITRDPDLVGFKLFSNKNFKIFKNNAYEIQHEKWAPCWNFEPTTHYVGGDIEQISDFVWWEKIFIIWPKDINLKYLSILTITHSFPPHNDI